MCNNKNYKSKIPISFPRTKQKKNHIITLIMGCNQSKSTTTITNNHQQQSITKQTTSTNSYVYQTPTINNKKQSSTPNNNNNSTISPTSSKKRPRKLKLTINTNDSNNVNSNDNTTTKLARKSSLDGSIIKESLQIIHTPKPTETKIVNQYRWMSNFPIGTGTSAKVFVCEDIDRSRLIAMKVVNKKLLTKMSHNFEASYRSDGFKREVAVLKRLKHENIARLYEVIDDTKHNLLYLAMEYFDGGDLGDSNVPTSTIPEKQAKIWSKQILEALRYCHDNNVVHRDLKTENILKLKDGSRVALVDFGMSHIWEQKQNEEEEEEEEKEEETKSDNEKKKTKKSKQDKLRKAMGTHLYFAPEIVKNKYGKQQLDGNTLKKGRKKRKKTISFHGKPIDIWAFGVVLFKLLRGVVPYFNENRVETLRLIANADPLNDIDLTTGFSNELSSFMKGILNPDPMKRLTAEQALNHNWLHDIVKLTPLKPRDTSIIDNAVNDDEMNQAISTLSFTQIVMLKTQARRLAIKARERAAVKIQTPMRIKLAKARVAKIRMENAKKFEDSYKENISTLKKSQSLYSLKGNKKYQKKGNKNTDILSLSKKGNNNNNNNNNNTSLSLQGRSNSVTDDSGRGMNNYLPTLPNLGDDVYINKMYRGPTDTSNWLIRGRIMVGSSPGTHLNQTLKYNKKNAIKELKLLRNISGITTYVSMQQVNESLKFKPMYQTLLKKVYTTSEEEHDDNNDNTTTATLSPSTALRKHRNPKVLNKEPTFIRQPVVDGMVMTDEAMISLIKRLKELFDNKEVLYLHCYGGHGRAGTVASLLLAVIYDLQPDDAMEYVQKYHNTRIWTENSESPASEVQRLQVRRLLASGNLK